MLGLWLPPSWEVVSSGYAHTVCRYLTMRCSLLGSASGNIRIIIRNESGEMHHANTELEVDLSIENNKQQQPLCSE